MFTTVLVIASITLAFAAGTAAGHRLGRRASRPVIQELAVQLANANWHLAHDQLTGALTRRALHTQYFALGTTGSLAVALIDVDEFKDVNDTYGHAAGDHLLAEVAYRLGHIVWTHGGRLARLSGDEFAAVIPLGDRDPAALAERLLDAFTAPFDVPADNGPTSITATASVGVTVADTGVPMDRVALHQADTAMYHAKQSSGNTHSIYVPGMVMPERQHRRGPRPRDLRHDRPQVSAE